MPRSASTRGQESGDPFPAPAEGFADFLQAALGPHRIVEPVVDALHWIGESGANSVHIAAVGNDRVGCLVEVFIEAPGGAAGDVDADLALDFDDDRTDIACGTKAGVPCIVDADGQRAQVAAVGIPGAENEDG